MAGTGTPVETPRTRARTARRQPANWTGWAWVAAGGRRPYQPSGKTTRGSRATTLERQAQRQRAEAAPGKGGTVRGARARTARNRRTGRQAPEAAIPTVEDHVAPVRTIMRPATQGQDETSSASILLGSSPEAQIDRPPRTGTLRTGMRCRWGRRSCHRLYGADRGGRSGVLSALPGLKPFRPGRVPTAKNDVIRS